MYIFWTCFVYKIWSDTHTCIQFIETINIKTSLLIFRCGLYSLANFRLQKAKQKTEVSSVLWVTLMFFWWVKLHMKPTLSTGIIWSQNTLVDRQRKFPHLSIDWLLSRLGLREIHRDDFITGGGNLFPLYEN